jgi:hypothetical protein
MLPVPMLIGSSPHQVFTQKDHHTGVDKGELFGRVGGSE